MIAATEGDFVAYPSRWRLALLFLLSIGFTVLGANMAGLWGTPIGSASDSDWTTLVVGWTGMAFFGLCSIAIAFKVFATGERLRIGRAGIRWMDWSDVTIPWSEIAEVSTWEYRRQRFVVLHLRHPEFFRSQSRFAPLTRFNRSITGGDLAITLTGTDRSAAQALAAIEAFRPAGG